LDRNFGFAPANNIGIRHASGSVLALINSDVVVRPGCLQTLAGFLDSHADVGLAGPKIFGPDGKVQFNCRRLPTVWNTICRIFVLDRMLSRWSLFSGSEMRHLQHDHCGEVEALSGCFWVARTAAVKEVGGLDERFFFYAEDLDWSKRFRIAGWKIMFVPEATATHYGGGSSSNAPIRYSIEMLRANLIFWKKYHGFLGAWMFRILSMVHHGIRLIFLSFMRPFFWGHTHKIGCKLKENFCCLRWLLTGHEAGNS